MDIPTYTVVSRHSATCSDKAKGRDYTKCGCRKHIAVYDPSLPLGKQAINGIKFRNRQGIIPTKTRAWAEAEQIAQSYRDKHDPVKRELAEERARRKAAEAEKESQTVTIEKAVSAFLIWKSDNPSRRSSKLSGKTSDSAMTGYRTLLGNVQDGIVRRKGHLFTWLEQQKPKPILISDLTPVLVDAFRASWKMNDLTTNKNFTRAKCVL